jgi:hypothetical protein
LSCLIVGLVSKMKPRGDNATTRTVMLYHY